LRVAGCDSNNCPSKMPGSFTLPNRWATKLNNNIPPMKPKKTFAHGYATVVSTVGLRLNISLSLGQNALEEKGYNSVNQIVGYMLSGDPTYITNHKNARSIITEYERDDLLEMIIKDYLDRN